MPDPRQLEFWAGENDKLWEVLGPVAIKIYLSGSDNAIELLPPDVQALVNWDYFNAHIVEFLREYRLHTLTGITETTRGQVVSAIDEWLQSGESLDILIEKLTPILGARRAEMIAVTEVTRLYAEGNLAAWRSTGVVSGKRWNTAVDERVCPICAPLNGMIVDLDSNGFTSDAGGIGITSPPAHPRCRCWLTPVVSIASLEEEIKRILNG